MKNKVLSIFHAVIPYVKELRAMAGSMEGCILMQQLDYWFALKPDGFYKFLEPVQSKGKDEQGNPISGHRLYRIGDSWCEELNCTPHEFRRMFDAIGVRWNSKSEFMNATDPFCGRGYCSYVDRKENLTHYFRNHARVDAFLNQFVADGAQNLSSSEKRSTDLGELNPRFSETLASIDQRLPAEITLTTTAGGTEEDTNCKTKATVWRESELQGGIEEFINSSIWMQHKFGGVRSPVGFKSKVRKRITNEGPNSEDWETLTLWRASKTKPAPAEHAEDAKRASEKRQRLADAKKRYAAADVVQQKEIEFRFAVYLQASNRFAYKAYCSTGLDSGMVAGAFYEWLVSEL
ncbi:MAG: hypothetical protein NUV63_09685 [Gallionella sp.]|nr:hypothetical protein [Gallionella sp.]